VRALEAGEVAACGELEKHRGGLIGEPPASGLDDLDLVPGGKNGCLVDLEGELAVIPRVEVRGYAPGCVEGELEVRGGGEADDVVQTAARLEGQTIPLLTVGPEHPEPGLFAKEALQLEAEDLAPQGSAFNTQGEAAPRPDEDSARIRFLGVEARDPDDVGNGKADGLEGDGSLSFYPRILEGRRLSGERALSGMEEIRKMIEDEKE
jgi:hypothetical protein